MRFSSLLMLIHIKKLQCVVPKNVFKGHCFPTRFDRDNFCILFCKAAFWPLYYCLKWYS